MLAAILLFIFLAGLFGLSYYFNSKTPVPPGCEKLKEDCKGCSMMSCPNRKGEDNA